MSKHTKTYSKRGSSVAVASIQFDKAINDGNKRPSASKSAGVVGKWGTTSFTSLRSSQVNGSKAGKRGLSPVKCLPVDYGSSNSNTPVIAPHHSGVDTFSFESGGGNSLATNSPVQPRPRKFFKSRGTEDTSKNVAVTASTNSSVGLNSYSDYPISHHSENLGGENLYTGGASSVGYISPSYTSPTAKAPGKRGRGRPRGSRSSASPRRATTTTQKTTPARGAPRGRRRGRGNRSVRGQQGAGRGKRKRAQWEESESEEEAVSSDLDEPDEEPELAAPIEPADEDQDDEGQEDEEEEEEEEAEEDAIENKNGADHGAEEEPPKPPIKLRIVMNRRNDTAPFVTKVGSEPTEEAKNEIAPPDPTSSPLREEVSIPSQCQQNGLEDPQTVCENSSSTPDPMDVKGSPDDSSPAEEVFQAKSDTSEEPVAPPVSATSVLPTVSEEYPLVSQPTVQKQQKKSSIFKSRFNSSQTIEKSSSIGGDSQATSKGKKGLALYRHKWNEDDGLKGASGNALAATNAPATLSGGTSEGSHHSHPSPWDDLGDEAGGPPAKTARLGPSSNASSAIASKVAEDFEEEASSESGGLRCNRKTKDYYTVVRNVKKAHQIQESGEFQEFNDDVDYILDALQDRNPTATRCLSAMSLASKCMEPAFRMHLRAHSTVAKFFQALKDAPSKASVALCTSCIMFVLTQDRLNMDLDRDSLELMLNLLEIDAVGQVDVGEGKELEKNKLKVRELCEEMVRKGHAPHLQLDKITAAQLAMETLLSLTSKKAGEWFKEELRVLGGLDHIIQTVTSCTATLTPPLGERILEWNWDKTRLDALKKVDRCLRVLENVTFQNEENQNYLMEYSNGVLVDATLKLLQMLSREVAAYSQSVAKDSLVQLLSETLSNLMKVVMNLTHDSNDDSIGSRVYGDRPLTWETIFVCLLYTSPCLTEDKHFDIMTLALGVLINLVERSPTNRDRLMVATIPSNSEDIFEAKSSAVRSLIDLFAKKEESARLEEARTDAILDGKPGQADVGTSQSTATGSEESASSSTAGKNQEDAMEETVKKLLHKAGRHMEDSMVAAYVALLLGYITMNNGEYERQVKELLPEKKFTLMVVVLKKFYEFLKLTANAVTSTRGLKNTQLVIKFMETSDRKHDAVNVKAEKTRCSISDDDM